MFRWLFGKRKKVGLVLGGGVARGIAHIGVLKVLQNYKVPIAFVAGTSAGSLIAAVYASGMDLSLLEEISLRIKWSDFFKLTLFRPGFVSAEAIEGFVVKYIGDIDISELKIPYAAVATDIRTGEKVVIDKGRVAKAVAASATFPGVFAPETLDGKYLIDGGIASNVPVDVAREMGAEYVIASDVIPEKTIRVLPSEAMQVLSRSLDLILKKLHREEARRADTLIELEMEGEDIWHLDLNKAEKLIKAGEVAAHRMINKIRKDLRLRS
jgi:NTE family protein